MAPALAHDTVVAPTGGAHRAAGRGEEPAAEVDARANDFFIQRFRAGSSSASG
jgi:hypothetical protein